MKAANQRVDLDEAQLRLASDLNLLEMLRRTAAWGNGEVEERDGMLLCAGPRRSPVGYMNAAIRTGESGDPERELTLAREFFAARERGFTLWERKPKDGDLAAAAGSAGLNPLLEMPGMVLEEPRPETAPPESAQLRLVEDARGAGDFATVMAEAYVAMGMLPEIVHAHFSSPSSLLDPDVAACIAYVGGEPAAGAMMLLADGVAGIYWVGARPDFGRRGLGEACTRAVTAAGFERGARFVRLEASAQGEPIYRRMGYREINRYRWHVSAPASN